jgi:hypothetical protein
VEEREPLHTFGGKVNLHVTMEKRIKVFKKIKNPATIYDSTILTLGV